MAGFDWFEHFTRHPVLLNLFLEMTNQCNLRCRHCGSSCSAENAVFLEKEKIARLLRRVAQAYDLNHLTLTITGGEPLLHPDFFDIMEDAAALGFRWSMTTNATLITPQMAQRLRKAGMRTVAVSLDGLEEQHDMLRAMPGAYKKAVRGVKALQEAGFNVQITTVVHHENIVSLQDMLKTYRAMGAASWKPINIEPIGRARDEAGLMLSTEEYRTLLEMIRRQRRRWGQKMEITFGCSHYLPPQYEKKVRSVPFRCGAGIFIASVRCNGDIGACLDIENRPELVQGNIDCDDFVDVWENRFEVFRKDRADLCSDCKTCDCRSACHGDSAHTWDWDENRPMICLRKDL